jgi:hypothetical protein
MKLLFFLSFDVCGYQAMKILVTMEICKQKGRAYLKELAEERVKVNRGE